MTPLDRTIVRRKLAHIVASLNALEPLARLSGPEYREKEYERRAAERLLQLVVEAAIDVNTHVSVNVGRPVPESAFASFTALADAGVISSELAERLAPSAGLRNRLVHQYEDIDDEKVRAAIAGALEYFPVYVGQVEAFLVRHGGEPSE